MRNKLAISLIFGALLLLSACNGGEIYYRFRHVPQGKWHKDSVLVFNVDSLHAVPARVYDVSVEIVSNGAYPYRNLWLYVSHNLADTVFRTDSLQIMLADEFGKPLGSGVGGLHQLSAPYASLTFPDDTAATRIRQVRIRHAMSDNPLTGIEKVGVKIEEKQ